MKPIEMLLKEHRLIEKMLSQLKQAIQIAKITGNINNIFLETEIDFFQNFVDRNHHEKEEEHLFRALNRKPLLMEHRRTLSKLIGEHRVVRLQIWTLQDAKKRYERNIEGAIDEVLRILEELLSLYQMHIETEEKHFFYPSMKYFSEEELDEIMQQFSKFNKLIDYEKYVQTAEHFEYPITIQPIQNK